MVHVQIPVRPQILTIGPNTITGQITNDAKSSFNPYHFIMNVLWWGENIEKQFKPEFSSI